MRSTTNCALLLSRLILLISLRCFLGCDSYWEIRERIGIYRAPEVELWRLRCCQCGSYHEHGDVPRSSRARGAVFRSCSRQKGSLRSCRLAGACFPLVVEPFLRI